MDVRCEKCQTEYELDESKLKPGGVTVKCTTCGHMFKVRRQPTGHVSSSPLPPQVDPAAFSTRSIVALAYLVVFGSWVAFTAFAWLLQNAPISKVSTYAYVNPVVAIFLGWLVLDEVVSATTIVGAAIIVASVALVIRIENARRPA